MPYRPEPVDLDGNAVAEELFIDQEMLDVEWLSQPMIALKYGREYASAMLQRNRLKERLEVIEAQLDSQARSGDATIPTGRGGAPTETAIKNWVRQQPAFEAANTALMEADYRLSVLTAVLTAVQNRRDALKNLVSLQQMLYGTSEHTEPPAATRERAHQAIRGSIREGLASST